MRIELNEIAFWLGMWCLIGITVATIAIVGIVYDTRKIDMYTSRGYTQATLPGVKYTQWVKEGK